MKIKQTMKSSPKWTARIITFPILYGVWWLLLIATFCTWAWSDDNNDIYEDIREMRIDLGRHIFLLDRKDDLSDEED